MKKTYSIMLDKKDVKKVMDLLIEMEAYFEVSPRAEFIKIYTCLDEEESDFIDSFLDTL